MTLCCPADLVRLLRLRVCSDGGQVRHTPLPGVPGGGQGGGASTVMNWASTAVSGASSAVWGASTAVRWASMAARRASTASMVVVVAGHGAVAPCFYEGSDGGHLEAGLSLYGLGVLQARLGLGLSHLGHLHRMVST